MKILIVANLYYPYIIGGGEISTQILCEGLIASGHQVKVLSSGKLNSEEIVNGVTVKRVPINIYWSYEKDRKSKVIKFLWHLLNEYNLIARKAIRKEFSSNNYDVIMSSTIDGFSGLIWKEAKKNKVKVVHILRSYSLACPRAGLYKNNKNCQNQCIECQMLTFFKRRHSNRYVDLVIGISDFILRKHFQLGYFKNSKSRIIYNPINSIISSLRNKIADNNPIVIGFVGSIQKKKGIELLLQEFSQIADCNLELHIFGNAIDKGYLDNLKDKYSKPSVRFLGYGSNIEIYKSINILVVPSLWNEPFGRIIAEAFANGIPVIGSNLGGIPELIDNNKTGYIFDPEIKGDLQKKIEKLAEGHMYVGMVENCIAASKSFTRKRIIDSFDQSLVSLIN